MNPFDFRGPEFLLFYLVFAGAVLFALYAARQLGEPTGPSSDPGLDDPYLYACLQGGHKHAIAVATASLLDRKLLEMTGQQIKVVKGAAAPTGNKLEEEVLLHYRAGGSVASMQFSPATDAARSYEDRLRECGLLPSTMNQAARKLRLILALLALDGVALAKIFIAFARGHSNVGFLFILAIVGSLVAVGISKSRARTRAGDTYLGYLQGIFSDLRQREIKPGSGGKELLWMAGLFGLSAVSATTFPFMSQLVRQFMPITRSGSHSSSSSGCGSSCSSSSCSSGCGGGGGCGGCGS